MREMQQKQAEWHEQWAMLQDQERFLFEEWIWPNRMADFVGKDVLEGGCGGGQHTGMVAEFARSVTAVDLNTVDIAAERNRRHEHVRFREADLLTMDLGCQFDVVFSVGVIHHTDDPDAAVANLARHVKPGGRLIVWVYSKEGNALVENVVEPIRKAFLTRLSRKRLLALSKAVTAVMYLPVYSLYLLPIPSLPYFEYFQNFRKLSFARNTLNVFDKLNAPQVQLIAKERILGWFPESCFHDISVTPYKGVSWRGSATRRRDD